MDDEKPLQLWEYQNRLKRDLEAQRKRTELLVRETHHRMANSMQVIASSAAAMLRGACTPEAAGFARKILVQTQGIARVYRALMIHQGNLELGAHLKILGMELERFFADTRPIAIKVTAVPLVVSADVGVPLSFIVHELVTNSTKYAFDVRPVGTINIALARSDFQHSKLTVMDDGRGFPVEVRANHGLALVSKLASTIGGSVHFRSNGGAEVSVIFPHETLPSLSPQPPAAA